MEVQTMPQNPHFAVAEVKEMEKVEVEMEELEEARDMADFLAVANQVLADAAIQQIWRVASRPPPREGTLPHCTMPGTTDYVYEPSEWWTAGFFPGSLWLLYERSLKRTLSIPSGQALKMARRWQIPLEKEQFNTETHDIGFMIMPSFQRDYILTGNEASRDVIINAAKSLVARWSETTQCIRSWELGSTKDYTYSSSTDDFLVIIDNMMNLDLLYYASELTGDASYSRIASAHAETTLRHHVRKDASTYHLVVYDPSTGAVKAKKTAQGYAHESTWARGQAWALYGFASAYKYTKRRSFLEASRRMADYFVSRLGEGGVVYWDFDAPRPGVWDTSAAMIACSGLLLLCQLDDSARVYLPAVFAMLRTCVDRARGTGDTILEHATINDYEHAHERIADHGLVYADYYFLEVGNRLLELGLN